MNRPLRPGLFGRPEKPEKLLIYCLYLLGLFWFLAGGVSVQAQVITEIIDATGDGGGNVLDQPRGLGVDASGNVFVGGVSSNVFRITPGGVISEIMDATGDGMGNTLTTANHLAVDGSGNVFVTGAGTNNVFKIETPTTCSTGGTPCNITEIMDATGDGMGNTFGDGGRIAIDASGNVFVASFSTDNAFKIETPGTCSTGGTPCTITEIIDATGDGGGNTLDAGAAIAVDASGNVFVVGLITDNVFKIDTPTSCSTGGTPCNIAEIIDAAGDGGGNTYDNPRSVATDASGNVFVGGGNTDNVFKIDTPTSCSTGGTPCTITEIIDFSGDGGGNNLDFPQRVATDALGNVYVGTITSDNVFQIATPTSCSTSGTPCTITEIMDATGDGMGNNLDAVSGIVIAGSNIYVSAETSDNAFRIEGVSLPVELVTFEAVTDGAHVLLQWTTASENLNFGFEVEHRAASRDAWHRAGFVEGAGTTTEPRRYHYRLGPLPAGRHFVRLKQLDFDGSFAYSPEVGVTIEVPGAYALSAPYPNPFNPQTAFTLTVAAPQEVEVGVYNGLGRQVARLFRGEMAAQQVRRFTFSAEGLPSGYYNIVIRGEHFQTWRGVLLIK